MTIITPYRDRPNQLPIFLKHMRTYLPGAHLVIVEQADNKPFNRGKLLNVGWLETLPEYAVMHDIDMLPVDVDYTPTPGVTQLAGSTIQTHGYLGGVTMFDADTFKRLGGYNNEYFHRAEDNELMHNCIRLGVHINERFGTYQYLPHERTGPEFIPWLWAKSKQRRQVQNQLRACKYKILDRVDTAYTHFFVEL